ncbi:MAG: hypothetical protein ACKO9H_08425 [Planctomycetota bacterium]
MNKLPEFRVTLTRLQEGEQAYPIGGEVPHYEYQGRRTKLGGDPDYTQGDDTPPKCAKCKKAMTFVAQIDSVEHDWSSNPHRIDCLAKPKDGQEKWMFGDAGMNYVFFCFDCLKPLAGFQCG